MPYLTSDAYPSQHAFPTQLRYDYNNNTIVFNNTIVTTFTICDCQKEITHYSIDTNFDMIDISDFGMFCLKYCSKKNKSSIVWEGVLRFFMKHENYNIEGQARNFYGIYTSDLSPSSAYRMPRATSNVAQLRDQARDISWMLLTSPWKTSRNELKCTV